MGIRTDLNVVLGFASLPKSIFLEMDVAKISDMEKWRFVKAATEYFTVLKNPDFPMGSWSRCFWEMHVKEIDRLRKSQAEWFRRSKKYAEIKETATGAETGNLLTAANGESATGSAVAAVVADRPAARPSAAANVGALAGVADHPAARPSAAANVGAYWPRYEIGDILNHVNDIVPESADGVYRRLTARRSDMDILLELQQVPPDKREARLLEMLKDEQRKQ